MAVPPLSLQTLCREALCWLPRGYMVPSGSAAAEAHIGCFLTQKWLCVIPFLKQLDR